MTATALSIAPSENSETVDFLRRLASMMSGGRNAEMLLAAADSIETLGTRAMTAEQLHSEQQEAHQRSNELREVAELAADNLHVEVDCLKTQLAEAARQAEADQAEPRERKSIERLRENALRLSAPGRGCRKPLRQDARRTRGIAHALAERSDAVVAVPDRTLRLARAQFDFLADGFAESGDVISQTICEIGRCAIEQALAGTTPAK